jgi:hypothetical protein
MSAVKYLNIYKNILYFLQIGRQSLYHLMRELATWAVCLFIIVYHLPIIVVIAAFLCATVIDYIFP